MNRFKKKLKNTIKCYLNEEDNNIDIDKKKNR